MRTFFAVHPKGLVARIDGDRVVRPTEAELAAWGARLDDAHPLGKLGADDAFALELPDRVPEPFKPMNVRALMLAANEPELFRLAGRALHVVDWASTSRFCGRCGTRTERVASERNLKCPKCELSHYPRISPAIITLVRRGDEALLASNAKFPGAFYSTLAGFSEIGESLEETLAREVFEEVGVRVKNARYFGSQPWPFPHSLMIAFTAEHESGDIRIDPAEISDAKWFKADALPQIPPKLSIARALIDAWVAETAGS